MQKRWFFLQTDVFLRKKLFSWNLCQNVNETVLVFYSKRSRSRLWKNMLEPEHFWPASIPWRVQLVDKQLKNSIWKRSSPCPQTTSRKFFKKTTVQKTYQYALPGSSDKGCSTQQHLSPHPAFHMMAAASLQPLWSKRATGTPGNTTYRVTQSFDLGGVLT